MAIKFKFDNQESYTQSVKRNFEDDFNFILHYIRDSSSLHSFDEEIREGLKKNVEVRWKWISW